MQDVLRGLAWLALLAGLTMPSLMPGSANITSLTLMGLGLVILALQPTTRAVTREPAIRLTLLAGGILLVALVPTATTPLSLAAVLILAPLWFVGAHSAVLQQLGLLVRPKVVSIFSLAGAAGGAIVAGIDVLVFGQDRGGWLVNNPIHLADLSLMLGFVALVGLTEKSRLKFLFWLGPLLGLITVWFSGSRGPLLAFGPMLLLGGGTLAWLMLTPKRAALLVCGGMGLLSLAAFALIGSGAAGRLGQVADLGALLTGSSTDASANERLHMLQSAIRAFRASPIYGHGLIDYASVAQSYVSDSSAYGPWDHLHNDAADFAVAGGTLGLVCYTLLLVAPLASSLSSQGPWRKASVYLGVVTPVGYLSMGLTNAMFGILAQTTLYAVILSLIATLSRQNKDGAV